MGSVFIDVHLMRRRLPLLGAAGKHERPRRMTLSFHAGYDA
jgi:hypothetical protein